MFYDSTLTDMQTEAQSPSYLKVTTSRKSCPQNMQQVTTQTPSSGKDICHPWVHLFVLLSICSSTRRRKWQPTPVFLPGESQGQRRLVGCRLWGRTVRHDWSDLACMHALEKAMATHSSVLAWRIPGMGSHRVRHDWHDLAAAAAPFILSCINLSQTHWALMYQAIWWSRRIWYEQKGTDLYPQRAVQKQTCVRVRTQELQGEHC